MKSGIYQIKNTLNNKKYIGSSKNLQKRLYEHKRTLKLGTHHSIKLQRAWNKYGDNNFIFEVLLECDCNDLIKNEQKYFDLYKPEYNILEIASSTIGHKHSMETKVKIGLKSKGRLHTIESKKKISDANKGKKLTNEHKKIIKEHNLGKKHTAESRENMSLAKKGSLSSERAKELNKKGQIGRIYKPHSEETKLNLSKKQKELGNSRPRLKNIQQFSMNGDLIKIWKDSKEIIEFFNMSNISPISKVINGIEKSYKGYIWKLQN